MRENVLLVCLIVSALTNLALGAMLIFAVRWQAKTQLDLDASRYQNLLLRIT